ncbi:MAG: hypothetical protein JSR60_09445 [Proteobacteria bacterium]|nr:hypothetical protein [Pseudomonadota bacterium]
MASTLPNLRSATSQGRTIAGDLRAFVEDGVDPKLAAKLLAIAEELDSAASTERSVENFGVDQHLSRCEVLCCRGFPVASQSSRRG